MKEEEGIREKGKYGGIGEVYKRKKIDIHLQNANWRPSS